MPFKLRLKKSRQYNVVSKSLFVICVELLDTTTIECTLSSENIGRECLENVCQRLGLQQPEFFGLRYVSAHPPHPLRWVEMDRPLKRQLDKYAREPNLSLRVMYYISGINLIHDEMTRQETLLEDVLYCISQKKIFISLSVFIVSCNSEWTRVQLAYLLQQENESIAHTT